MYYTCSFRSFERTQFTENQTQMYTCMYSMGMHTHLQLNRDAKWKKALHHHGWVELEDVVSKGPRGALLLVPVLLLSACYLQV